MKKKNNARARARADVFFCLLFFKILFLLVSFVNLFKMSNLPCNKISGLVILLQNQSGALKANMILESAPFILAGNSDALFDC